MTRHDRPEPQAQVRRGVRVPPVTLVHCALVATIAFIFVPYREIFTRWRSTLPYLLGVAASSGILHRSELPWWLAAAVSVIILVFSVGTATVVEMRWLTSDLWRARRGLDGAVILTRWNHRKSRHELHTWATFRHHRGLGRLVLNAAWAQAPRPLWLNPATPGLRKLYLDKGAIPDPDGSRWLVVLGE